VGNSTVRATDRAGAPERARGGGLAVFSVAFAFWITMAGTTAPTPLYPLYGEEFGFTPFTVTVVFAVYALGVVLGLLVFGRLSDQVGRRPVLVAATLLSVCAAVVFLLAQNVPAMLVARVISGFSAASSRTWADSRAAHCWRASWRTSRPPRCAPPGSSCSPSPPSARSASS
jgi:MFS family permease